MLLLLMLVINAKALQTYHIHILFEAYRPIFNFNKIKKTALFPPRPGFTAANVCSAYLNLDDAPDLRTLISMTPLFCVP